MALKPELIDEIRRGLLLIKGECPHFRRLEILREQWIEHPPTIKIGQWRAELDGLISYEERRHLDTLKSVEEKDRHVEGRAQIRKRVAQLDATARAYRRGGVHDANCDCIQCLIESVRENSYENFRRNYGYGWRQSPSPDHYATLGVQQGASQDEIKAAYKRRAFECHPDRGGKADDLKAVNAAYAALRVE